MISASDLRTIDVFADQPEDSLAWLAGVTEDRRYTAGERPFELGAPATHMTIMLEGSVHLFTHRSGSRTLFATLETGDVSGLLPFSRMETYGAEAVAVGEARMGLVPERVFGEMVTRMPEVGKRLVALMTDRVRETGRFDQQREKLMALGKLSAGLAHELNNPAAAIRRGASELQERVSDLAPLVARLMRYGLTPEQVENARGAMHTCTAPTPGTLGALERSEKEDRLADWLSDHKVAQPYILAETLAAEGVTIDALDHLAAHVPDGALPDMVRWVERGIAADRLLAEIMRAAGRISELVAAVKGYSHMDQAQGRQRTDVHDGLDQTLTMLGHDVKAKGARVERRYGTDVPEVCAFAGALNQVWTNLLDNALDAIPAGGHVEVETRREGELVAVTITDSGPGIPDDVKARIWDPFFTTKPLGEGTGVGLDVVLRIVKQHGGHVDLDTEPGRTAFTVHLPIDEPSKAPATNGAAAVEA